MSGTRQVLRGGYTLIRYNSSNGITSEESDYADYSPQKKDGKTIHTEPLFYSNISNTLLSELNTVDCIGAIIEINQVNSICSTCQKYLASKINNLKTSTNKKIILRAQATKLYEAQGGEIATANTRYLSDRKIDDTGAIMDDLSDGEGWVGIHKFVPPYSGRDSFVSGEGLSDSSSYETPSDDDEYN